MPWPRGRVLRWWSGSGPPSLARARCWTARTGRGASHTRTTPPRAARSTSSRTSCAIRCCPATPTLTPKAQELAWQPGSREEARQIIHDAVGGTDDHLVIFCGSGATAAVSKLIGILELRLPDGPTRRYRLLDQIPPQERPVVFVGPSEHHSNELPWRETIADVVVIGADADGHIDLDDLSAQLARYAQRPLRIGSFSAAS